MTNDKSLANGYSQVSNAGLDSFGDNYEQRQEKFAVVKAAVWINLDTNSPETKDAAKKHLTRLEELVDGALD